MTKLLLFISLLLGSVSAFAQANFRPGYIVPLTGDTLRGEVDSRLEKRNAILCRFRQSPGADVTEYKADQLRAYGITGGYNYQSHKLPNAARTPTFLQALVLGKASLYRFSDTSDKENYYVLSPISSDLQLLAQHDTLITNSLFQNITLYRPLETTIKTRKYLFRTTLWPVMADCPSVQITLNRTELKESEMIKLFTTYNSCVGRNQYAIKSAKSKIGFEVLAGVYQSTITVNNFGEREIKSGPLLMGGIGFLFAPAKFNERFTLHLQALYAQQEYNDAYQANGTGIFVGEKSDYKTYVRLASVQVPFLLRYSVPKGKIRPFFQAGPVVALHVQKEAEWSVSRQQTLSDVRTTPIALRSKGIGGMVGAGVSIPTGQRGALQLGVRADLFDATSQASGILSGSRGVSFLTGYTFGK